MQAGQAIQHRPAHSFIITSTPTSNRSHQSKLMTFTIWRKWREEYLVSKMAGSSCSLLNAIALLHYFALDHDVCRRHNMCLNSPATSPRVRIGNSHTDLLLLCPSTHHIAFFGETVMMMTTSTTTTKITATSTITDRHAPTDASR